LQIRKQIQIDANLYIEYNESTNEKEVIGGILSGAGKIFPNLERKRDAYETNTG